VTATAREGYGTVTVVMMAGGNLQQLAQDVRNAVDRITSFPGEIEKPRVTVVGIKPEVVTLVLYGDYSEQTLRQSAENIRDRLMMAPDITQVTLAAIRPYEISIEVPQENLRAHGLTLPGIARRIRSASLDQPAGGIRTDGGEVLVRMKERRYTGGEFSRIPVITASDGTELLLQDIAEIRDGFSEIAASATFNGKPAIMIKVFRTGDQTPITVADAVTAQLPEIRRNLPQSLTLDILDDLSRIYRHRMKLLKDNAYLGLLLVFICLAVFLEARLAFWVSLGIPISFLGSLIIIPSLGVSINMVSTFAFIVTLGIVVDDAIIVGENIYQKRHDGMPFFKAAVEGAQEIALPVTFSVITNMVAFLPMYFVPGSIGIIFKQIPLVVISVFIISLVESLLILPAHLGHQKKRQPHPVLASLTAWQQAFSEWFTQMVHQRYQPFLIITIRYRYGVVAIAFAVMAFTIALLVSGKMGMTLMPQTESDTIVAQATLPVSSAVEKTKTVRDTLVRAAQAVTEDYTGTKLVKGIYAQTGGRQGENAALVVVLLTDSDTRPLTTAEFTQKWRDRVGDQMAGLEALSFEAGFGGPGGGGGADLTVELSHRNLSALREAGRRLAKSLEGFPEAKDINDGFIPGKRQFDFHVTPEGRSVGLTAAEIAAQVRAAFYGAEALRQQRDRSEVKVMVRLPRSERRSEYHLEELMLRAPDGAEIPLAQAAASQMGRAYTAIERRNARRTIQVTAKVAPIENTGRIIQAISSETLPALAAEFQGLSYSFEGKQADIKKALTGLSKGLILAIMCIYTLLAIPFRSYVQPLIIMVAIPFGIVGAVLGHLIMGYSLSVISVFGLLALAGVVVNDSLVLIEFSNRRRLAGQTPEEAVIAASIHRFRPILLTTLTTFGGLAPMIFETSPEARFMIPMAISLGFGVLAATLITLILVPALYLIIEDIRPAAIHAESSVEII